MQNPQDNHDSTTDNPGSTNETTATLEAAPGGDALVPVERTERDHPPMFCTACGTKNSMDANYCKQCGHRLERTGPLKISEEAFAEAGSPDELVRAYLSRAYSRYELGDFALAVECCLKAIAVLPESTDAHSLLSTLYEKMGSREKAIAEREIVLQLNPGSIADREKLEQLRDEEMVITPRKIISSRSHGATLFDSRAGAAVVAVAVTLFIMVAGLAAVLFARNRPLEVQAQTPAGTGITLPNRQGVAAANPQWSGQQADPRPFTGQSMPAANQVGVPASSTMITRSSQPASQDDGAPVRPIPPASVRIPSGINNGGGFSNNIGNQDMAANRGSTGGGTVHLPDNGLGASEIGQAPTPPEPPKNRGKIEITVTSDPNAGRNAQGQSQANRSDENSGTTMDSRNARRIAQDYQVRSQYKLAATSYIKALDGAGEDAAGIHLQIGLCYQRLDERDSAIAQYNAAIAAYKEQIAAGRNTDAANRGIRAAEAGIKACQ